MGGILPVHGSSSVPDTGNHVRLRKHPNGFRASTYARKQKASDITAIAAETHDR
jgi:hypothetical protein